MSLCPPFEFIGFASYLESTEGHPTANDQLFRCTRAGTHWVPVPNHEAGRPQVCKIALQTS